MKQFFATISEVKKAFPSYSPTKTNGEKKCKSCRGKSYEKIGEGAQPRDLSWRVGRIAIEIGLLALSLFLIPILIKPYRKLVAKLWRQCSSGEERFLLYLLKNESPIRTLSNSIELECSYFLNEGLVNKKLSVQNRSQCTFHEDDPQIKIEKIKNDFRSDPLYHDKSIDGEIDKVSLIITKFSKTERVKIAALVQISLPYDNVNTIFFRYSENFSNISDIPDDQAVRFKNKLLIHAKRSKNIAQRLKNILSSDALEKLLTTLAKDYCLKIDQFCQEKPLRFRYSFENRSLIIENAVFHYRGYWNDGNNYFFWDQSRKEYLDSFFVYIKEVDLDRSDILKNRLLNKIKREFNLQLKALIKKYPAPKWMRDNNPFSFNSLTDYSPLGFKGQIASALIAFEITIDPEEKWAENQLINWDIDMTREVTKEKYKRAALKYHPDRGGSGEKFKAISSAYNIIVSHYKFMGLKWE